MKESSQWVALAVSGDWRPSLSACLRGPTWPGYRAPSALGLAIFEFGWQESIKSTRCEIKNNLPECEFASIIVDSRYLNE